MKVSYIGADGTMKLLLDSSAGDSYEADIAGDRLIQPLQFPRASASEYLDRGNESNTISLRWHTVKSSNAEALLVAETLAPSLPAGPGTLKSDYSGDGAAIVQLPNCSLIGWTARQHGRSVFFSMTFRGGKLNSSGT